MNGIKNQFSSIGQVTDTYLANRSLQRQNTASEPLSFEKILKEKQECSKSENLRFSRHASERLLNRNIELSREQIERLEQGTKRASEKGIAESLVLMDELAFIVNIPNQTVITAMNQKDQTESVFTNIDGAVIV